MKHCRVFPAIMAALVLVLALALLPLPVAGADSTAVSIDAPAEAAAGSEFIALVAVDYVEDFDSCGFDVVYDETIITVIDVTGGEINGHSIPVGPANWSYIPAGSGDTGRTRVIAFLPGVPEPGVSGAGYVAEIHFEVLGSAGETATIALESVGFYDWQGDPISTTTDDHAVQISTATDPTIAFGPRSFAFSATEGEANPASQTLEIWNSGPGTLDWSVSSNAQWLRLSPASGSSTGERDSITVSVDIAGLTAGDYSSDIVIEAPGATNAQRVASISLEIATAPVPPDNDNDNDEPPGRSSMVVLWIVLGAVVVAGVILLVLRRGKSQS